MKTGRPKKEFTWNYTDLVKLTDLSEDVIRQHIVRGKLSDNLGDLVVYLATHANPVLRLRLHDAVMRRISEESVGKPKKKKAVQRKKNPA